MEATFDNKTNVLEANIRATYDNSVIYRIRTTYSGLRGRAVTFLEDANSGILTEGRSTATVGAIHWKEKTLEVHDHKKPCSEIKRRQGSMFSRSRYWSWGEGRKEYKVAYHDEEWKATVGEDVAAQFAIPFRPHLFTKTTPPRLQITEAALQMDEVFLILVFIYSEAKRQDNTGSSTG